MHGRPIAGVVVTAVKANETAGKTATVDEKGAFTISGLEPGTYIVSITLPGRAPQMATQVDLGAREEQELPIVTERNPALHDDRAGECGPDPGGDGAGTFAGKATDPGSGAEFLYKLPVGFRAADAEAEVQAGAAGGNRSD